MAFETKREKRVEDDDGDEQVADQPAPGDRDGHGQGAAALQSPTVQPVRQVPGGRSDPLPLPSVLAPAQEEGFHHLRGRDALHHR